MKRAIDDKSQYISIKSVVVAKHVSVVKNTPKAVVVAATVACGVSVSMIWNPVGWLSTAATAAVGTSLAAAVSYRIVGTFRVLYEDYKIIGRGTAKLKNCTRIV